MIRVDGINLWLFANPSWVPFRMTIWGSHYVQILNILKSNFNLSCIHVSDKLTYLKSQANGQKKDVVAQFHCSLFSSIVGDLFRYSSTDKSLIPALKTGKDLRLSRSSWNQLSPFLLHSILFLQKLSLFCRNLDFELPPPEPAWTPLQKTLLKTLQLWLVESNIGCRRGWPTCINGYAKDIVSWEIWT